MHTSKILEFSWHAVQAWLKRPTIDRLPRMWVVREPARWQCRVFRECRKIGVHSHSALELL